MGFENIQTLTHATERDIDLLLVEEFKCNPNFTRHFVSIVNDNLLYSASNVIHSKRRTHNRREIDICLQLSAGDTDSYILIENKLDATEQKEQAESYQEECEFLMREGKAKNTYAVLVCPSSYKDSNPAFASKFNTTITYEKISEVLNTLADESSHNELASRFRYRSVLLKQAIEKERRGYEAIIRPEIGDFNKQYIELLKQDFPLLKPGTSMLKQGNPSESKTMIFDSKILPKADFLPQLRIVHQLREGNANINFYGWGNEFEKIAPTIKQDLVGTNLKVAATINKRKGGNSGLMIYAPTPKVDNLTTFDEQKDSLLQGMRLVDELRRWAADNPLLLKKWAEIV